MSGGKTVWNMAALDLRGVSVSKFSLSDVASQNDSDLSKGYYFIRSSVDCSFKIDADPATTGLTFDNGITLAASRSPQGPFELQEGDRFAAVTDAGFSGDFYFFKINGW